MEYIISDTSIIRISESSGVIQNVCNNKILLSNKESFSEKYLLKPNNEVSFKGTVYARAPKNVKSVIKFNVVSFVAWSGGSGSSDNPDDTTAENVPTYLDDLLSGGDDGYDNADTNNYINDIFSGDNDSYNNPDTNEYFDDLLNNG